jgi:hypothetical protein
MLDVSKIHTYLLLELLFVDEDLSDFKPETQNTIIDELLKRTIDQLQPEPCYCCRDECVEDGCLCFTSRNREITNE